MHLFLHLLPRSLHRYTFLAIHTSSIFSSLTLYLCCFYKSFPQSAPSHITSQSFHCCVLNLDAFNVILAALLCPTSMCQFHFCYMPYIILGTASLFHISLSMSHLHALILATLPNQPTYWFTKLIISFFFFFFCLFTPIRTHPHSCACFSSFSPSLHTALHSSYSQWWWCSSDHDSDLDVKLAQDC